MGDSDETTSPGHAKAGVRERAVPQGLGAAVPEAGGAGPGTALRAQTEGKDLPFVQLRWPLADDGSVGGPARVKQRRWRSMREGGGYESVPESRTENNGRWGNC